MPENDNRTLTQVIISEMEFFMGHKSNAVYIFVVYVLMCYCVGTNVLLCHYVFVLVRLMCDFGFVFKQSCISCESVLEFECSLKAC